MHDRLDMLEAILPELYDDSALYEAYVALDQLKVADQTPENQTIVEQSMTCMIESLLSIRRDSSDQEWNSFAKLCLRHPVTEFIHQDPFTHRAFTKPRGYAGDAELMDFIYERDKEDWSAPPGTTELGRMIFEYTTMSPASKGIRERRRFIGRVIDELAAQLDYPPEILSIACGHLRESSLSAAVKQRKLARFVGLDSDTSSLEEVLKCYEQYNVEVMPASIRQLLTNRVNMGEFDLVYSSGLFDYLQTTTAQRLAEHMFGMLKPGGRILIANMLPGIRDVGYMESYMDWKLIYRTRKEMSEITMNIPESAVKDVRTFSEENLNVIFLEVTKK